MPKHQNPPISTQAPGSKNRSQGNSDAENSSNSTNSRNSANSQRFISQTEANLVKRKLKSNSMLTAIIANGEY